MAWYWPVAGRVTQQPSSSHMAFDIGVPQGTPVIAPTGGWLDHTTPLDPSGYGNLVVLRTLDGLKIYLAHLSAFVQGLRPGDPVRPGQVVGYSGSTGRSTGPHVHFEVRGRDGRPTDPTPFVTGGALNQQTSSPAPRMRVPALPPNTSSLSGRSMTPAPTFSPVNRQGVSPAAAAAKLGQVSVKVVNQSAPQLQVPYLRNLVEEIAKWRHTPTGTPVADTPLGPITIPIMKWSWPTFGFMAAGIGLVLFSLPKVLGPSAEQKAERAELAREILPLAAGLVNPVAGVVASAATANPKQRTQLIKREVRKAQREGKHRQSEESERVAAGERQSRAAVAQSEAKQRFAESRARRARLLAEAKEAE